MTLGINRPNGQRGASEPAMDATLQKIRLRFIETVLERLLKFEELKQIFNSDPENITPLSELGALAHKIAGVAETLGFGDIGRLAASIDSEITRRLNSGVPAIAVWQMVEAQLEEMLEKMEGLL